jgi:hypothetical protein
MNNNPTITTESGRYFLTDRILDRIILAIVGLLLMNGDMGLVTLDGSYFLVG